MRWSASSRWPARRVEPFTEKQIALVTTFADQAVIAIENARLFNELRARTTELGRSVEELKMLSEVGQAVSSTLDLRAGAVDDPHRLARGDLGECRSDLSLQPGGARLPAGRGGGMGRGARTLGARSAGCREPRARWARRRRGACRFSSPISRERPSAPLRDATLAAGFHSALIVPLVGAERILGAIILMRQEAGEFPPETVRLMQTLASQSVLAIQNARLFREIADKSEQLALASQHKSQFLANMSHELRTPLNAILGYAELLVDGIYGVLPERPKGVLDRIQNNGKHLLALINDVLDLAKIEAGQLTLTLEDYTLPEVVRSVVTATEPLATAKGLKFTAAVQDDMPMAHGDARRVSQVLLNLVGNAIKFTDAGRGRDPRRCRQRPIRADRARHRAGHCRCRPGPDLWRVPADRQFEYAPERRHRAGSRDLEAHGRAAGRDDLGRIRLWARARPSGSYCRSMSMK